MPEKIPQRLNYEVIHSFICERKIYVESRRREKDHRDTNSLFGYHAFFSTSSLAFIIRLSRRFLNQQLDSIGTGTLISRYQSNFRRDTVFQI